MSTTGGGIDPVYQILLNNGVMGVMFMLTFIFNRIHTDGEVNVLKQQISVQGEIIRRFQEQLADQTLPALQRSAQVLEAIPNRESSQLGEMARLQTELTTAVERLEKLSKGQS